MKKERFYYSEPLSLGNVEAYLDQNNSIIGLGCLTKVSKLPRITVCGIWDTDNNTLTFGVARCSKTDIFERSKGRGIARNRAIIEPYRVVTIAPDEKVSDIFMKNAYEIEADVMSMVYPIKLS